MLQLTEPITVRPIKTEADYHAALEEIALLMGDVAPDTPDGEKLEVLLTLMEAYEEANYAYGRGF